MGGALAPGSHARPLGLHSFSLIVVVIFLARILPYQIAEKRELKAARALAPGSHAALWARILFPR